MSFDKLHFSLKQRQKFAKLDLVMKPIFVSGLDKRTVILCSKQRSSQCLPVAAAARPTLHQHPHNSEFTQEGRPWSNYSGENGKYLPQLSCPQQCLNWLR